MLDAVQSRCWYVDVFSEVPYGGNPVAVVLDGVGWSEEEMARFARWTNLSETTFVLPPTLPGADYRVRIFTPTTELPFAGHPTLGSCHAWIESGGVSAGADSVVQECGAGLVRLRREQGAWAFAAPPLIRSGAVDATELDALIRLLGLGTNDVVASQWVDNGPGWVGLLLRDAATVLGVVPAPLGDRYVGLIGPHPREFPERFEVRAFFPSGGGTVEDPVTGSLNASMAQWLVREGIAVPPYRVRQGTVLGRHGRIHVTADDPDLWIGGSTVTLMTAMTV